MALTRAEAIDLAVRRCLRRQEPALGGDQEWLGFWMFHPPVNAIRAHFRAITRTYGVVGTVGMLNDGDDTAADYDGHSLRY